VKEGYMTTEVALLVWIACGVIGSCLAAKRFYNSFNLFRIPGYDLGACVILGGPFTILLELIHKSWDLYKARKY
jgi:hypothetical protein